MKKLHRQLVTMTVTVLNARNLKCKDGDQVFVQWKRGLKEQNAGQSACKSVKKGEVVTPFEPIALHMSMFQERGSSKFESKFLSLALRSYSNTASGSITSGKKGKSSKGKLVGKLIVNLADYAQDHTNVVESMTVTSKKVSVGDIDVRIQTQWKSKSEVAGAPEFEDMTEMGGEDETATQTDLSSFAGGTESDVGDEETDMTELGSLTEDMVDSLIVDTVEYLREHALETEGIFRICGVLEDMAKIIDVYEHGYAVDFSSELTDHTVAGALKSFLRGLANPLLSFELYEAWLNAARAPEEQQETLLLQTLAKLGQSQFNALSILCHFLREVGNHHQTNKMTLDNLAVVFAPSLLWAPTPQMDVSKMMEEMMLSKLIVYLMISDPSTYFGEFEEMAFISAKREKVTLEEYANITQHEDRRKKKNLKKLLRKDSVVNRNTMKKLANSYAKRMYAIDFNILCVSKIPSALIRSKDCPPKLAVKWHKARKGDGSKGGCTTAQSPQLDTKCKSAAPGYFLQFTKSPLADACTGGAVPPSNLSLEDAEFTNSLEVKFYKSTKTENVMRKPFCFVLTGETKSGEKEVMGECLWDLAQYAQADHVDQVVDLEMLSEKTAHRFTLLLHVSARLLDEVKPRLTRSLSISGLLHKNERSSGRAERESPRHSGKEEKEKEKEGSVTRASSSEKTVKPKETKVSQADLTALQGQIEMLLGMIEERDTEIAELKRQLTASQLLVKKYEEKAQQQPPPRKSKKDAWKL